MGRVRTNTHVLMVTLFSESIAVGLTGDDEGSLCLPYKS